MSELETPETGEITKDEKTMAMLAHILGIFGFLGPLIIYAIKGNESKFVAYHAMQATVLTVGFTVFMIVIYVVTCGIGALLILPLIPLLIIAQVWIAMKANEGEWRGYPLIDQIGMQN